MCHPSQHVPAAAEKKGTTGPEEETATAKPAAAESETTAVKETAEAKLDLSRSQVAWSTRAVRVNGWRFSGPIDVDVIGRAICSAFVESYVFF